MWERYIASKGETDALEGIEGFREEPRNESDAEEGCLDELLPLVQRELRRIARFPIRKERQGHTFQATALVNEAYLKPVDQSRANWQNRPDEVGMKSVQQKLPRDEPLRCMLVQKEGENGNPGSNR